MKIEFTNSTAVGLQAVPIFMKQFNGILIYRLRYGIRGVRYFNFDAISFCIKGLCFYYEFKEAILRKLIVKLAMVCFKMQRCFQTKSGNGGKIIFTYGSNALIQETMLFAGDVLKVKF
jgi:hypothetical protein